MAGTTIPRGRLRRLAGFRPAHGRVLSIYFDLDPSAFPTGEARATQITSVCDEAGKRVEAMRDELDHEGLIGLREDVERIRDAFDPQSMGAGGTRGIAVFACGPAGLFETMRLPHPVDTRITIAESPDVGPITGDSRHERWVVALVSSRDGRLFAGDESAMEDLGDVTDSTYRAERRAHLHHVSDVLLALLRRTPFDRLLIGGPDPVPDEFEAEMHPYLRERLAGRVGIDVDTATAASVLQAAKPVFDEHRATRERDVLGRFKAALARDDGHAAAGRAEVSDALVQRKVEVLLLEPGVQDAEPLIDQAIDGSAEILVVDDETPDLGPHGGVAAVLRF